MATPIIDLFAGPGGLGEGFTSLVGKNNKRKFKIALSIEKDDFAHQTLTLRSFLRHFEFKKLPKEYYSFLKKEINLAELFAAYPQQYESAKNEAWKVTLGKVSHEEVDRRIKDALKGEKNFIVIGGPPCQAYSLVGRARRQEATGLNKEDHRVYLYREYYRILAVHNPPVFVMENVKGILSSKVDDEHIFKQIISDLQNPLEAYKKLQGKDKLPYDCPGYHIFSLVKKPHGFELDGTPLLNPKDFIICAERYGVPQARHRVILLGVRKDIKHTPELLQPAEKFIPIASVLNGLPALRSGLSKTKDGKNEWKSALQGIFSSPMKEEMAGDVWREMSEVVSALALPKRDRGGVVLPAKATAKYNADWYLDSQLDVLLNHESRSHITEDLHRYLFVSTFAKVNGRSPKLADFPKSLLPKHGNVQSGIHESKFADRFRVQLASQPAKTVTSHISKDGHYYIHPDPSQCRSLTVREAARIQTFPDNYYFCGPRTSQYHQVGNAVPPYLAFQISQVVSKLL